MISFRNDILPLKNQLYRLALRITLNSAEAEDIVQETLIRVWNRRDTWDSIDNIEAFCFTVCRNLSLDSVKRGNHSVVSLDEMMTAKSDPRSGSSSALAAEPQQTSSTPSQQAIDNDSLNIVRNIVDSLPEKQRSCIQLRDFEGKSYKDISTILGITEDQVKVNIFRGRKTIKERFEKLNNFRR